MMREESRQQLTNEDRKDKRKMDDSNDNRIATYATDLLIMVMLCLASWALFEFVKGFI